MKNTRTQKMVLCSFFVALITVGAFLKIPIPNVPKTLQLFFVLMAGTILGGKLGFISTSVYILLGFLGIPVFTQGGGIGYLAQPTFGYIIGFTLGAYVTGTIVNKSCHPGMLRLLVAQFCGLFVIYVIGMLYFYLISTLYLKTAVGLWSLFLYCFLIPLPGDIVLCILGAVLGKRLLYLLNGRNKPCL